MRFLRFLFAAAFGLSLSLSAAAQLNLAWRHTFSWNNLKEDAAQATAWTPQGDLYVVGFHYPRDGVYLQVIKYNAAGAYQWRRSFPSLAFLTAGQYPQIGVDSAGNLIVAAQNLNSSSTWMTVRKFAPNGAILWSDNVFGPHGYVVPAQLVVDSKDNVYVAATGLAGQQSNYTYNAITIKYNASGVRQWSAAYDGPHVNASVNGMAVDSNGNVFDLVTVLNAPDPVRIVSYSASGGRIGVTAIHTGSASQFYAGQAIVASANRLLVLLDNSNAPVTSALVSYTIVPATPVLPVRLNEQWVSHTSNRLFGLAVDRAGDAAAAGVDSSGTNASALEWDSAGKQIWRHSLALTRGGGYWNSVAVTPSGEVLLVGSEYATTTQQGIILIIVAVYSSSGALLGHAIASQGSAYQAAHGSLSPDGTRLAVVGQEEIAGTPLIDLAVTMAFNLF
ncbi:MAG: hypothetical protein KGJ62_14730 [Armatimonadetes bacterium]|nr:hypothetical protein [Armatimonadota bacterium]MDE2206357.1 hypothetical protein [Armatimonadota bacterium]